MTSKPKPQKTEDAADFNEAVAIIKRGNNVRGHFSLTMTQALTIAQLANSGTS
jgi:hypothetical protein